MRKQAHDVHTSNTEVNTNYYKSINDAASLKERGCCEKLQFLLCPLEGVSESESTETLNTHL